MFEYFLSWIQRIVDFQSTWKSIDWRLFLFLWSTSSTKLSVEKINSEWIALDVNLVNNRGVKHPSIYFDSKPFESKNKLSDCCQLQMKNFLLHQHSSFGSNSRVQHFLPKTKIYNSNYILNLKYLFLSSSKVLNKPPKAYSTLYKAIWASGA